ncbi:MAG: SLC13 family permease [Flavobacteriales bacterium]|nr:SLC13 family permease [Flavobacteriales bacterium]
MHIHSLLHKRNIGRVLGPLAFLLTLLIEPPEGLNVEGRAVLAVTLWVAIWWVTEAIPIEATALLPVVLFPLTGGLSLTDTLTGYSHPYIFLFIGGFILAIAMEKWNVHRRIALHILSLAGSSLPMIILGFMVGTAFLSMWISNTATAAMMLPIGMALISQTKGSLNTPFGKPLMLAIAYSASIGGTATLIGTPPNLILASVIEKNYGVEISFFQWFSIGLPFSILMLTIAWLYLTRVVYKLKGQKHCDGKEEIRRQLAELGPIKVEEKRVLAIFGLTGLAWMLRSYVLQPILPAINDTIIAITAALVLFVIPASAKNTALIKWDDAVKIPWGILILFGGGIALAGGFESSGLSAWLGSQLTSAAVLPLLALILVTIAAINFLTEITSNLATTALLLPVLGSLAIVADVHPFLLMAGAALAASCAFMLPVATPPNAIVFGSREITIPDMVRAGFGLNVISILILALLTFYVFPTIWGMDISPFPRELLSK